MNTGSSFTTTATFIFLLGLLAAGCRNTETASQMDTPQPTAASVYADAIGSARFERSAVKVEQGYTVESGNLYTRDGETGSLVVVRSPDGAVTSIIDEPGKRGLLVVDTKGKSTFTEEPAYDYLTPDALDSKDSEPAAKQGAIKAGEHQYIDMLVAYSAAAFARLNTDPVAYALAQLETANLGLRNSLVADLSLRLAAVNVFDVDYGMTDDGIFAWQTKLSPYRRLYSSDVNAVYIEGGGGLAYVGGYTSVNGRSSPEAFRHEIGHNVGGSHCNNNPARYSFGYHNGKSQTYLCGNKVPYYSTPAVRDAHGLPLGDAQTADMARVWRENGAWLSGFHPELPGLRMMLVSSSGEDAYAFATLNIPVTLAENAAIVALSESVGPTSMIPSSSNNTKTTLSARLLNAKGKEVTVQFRAQRRRASCLTEINVSNMCAGFPLHLEIKYYPQFGSNASLPRGYYNGLLKLEARSSDSNWKMPINIAVSIRK
ncbi:hypothetical protein [Pseudomonas citri]|uniref:hypothetical protein n=1 Tax=Pseudomonas citri TaxID=2978349 RepID=UPI0021B5CEA1|nr:hypothetical protein [Pseudomonas citri]